ncbi:MAG: cysteine desulfurase family protein [Alphaproteobacteria bacterium]|nr:cysteine desulfurase family protein [Alphaproteobacteria bacterium]
MNTHTQWISKSGFENKDRAPGVYRDVHEDARFRNFRRSEFERRRVYLDYNAMAPLRQSAKDVILSMVAMDALGNPSSVHSYGRAIRRKIEDVRRTIMMALGLENKVLIFTSGATESNNLALKNFPGRVLVSAIEHDSVFDVRSDAIVLPVLGDGTLDLEILEKHLSSDFDGPTLVSVMAANNETGIMQPLSDVCTLAKKWGAYVHSDAVQAIGRVDYPWGDLDMISVSSHKIGGLSGVGCLIINPTIPVNPLFLGGGQERTYRAGTENIIGICAMGAIIQDCIAEDWEPVQRLRDQLEHQLTQNCPDAVVFGKDKERLPNTTLITMPSVKSETQVMNFDLAGFAVSAGSACSSGKVKKSRVLQAMNVPETSNQCALRISLGSTIQENDLKRFAETWLGIYKKSLVRG